MFIWVNAAFKMQMLLGIWSTNAQKLQGRGRHTDLSDTIPIYSHKCSFRFKLAAIFSYEEVCSLLTVTMVHAGVLQLPLKLAGILYV